MCGSIRAIILPCVLLTLSVGLDAQDKPAATSPPPKSGAGTYSTLTRRHGGKFPDAYVSNVLRNGVNINAHGTAEMPIWGPLFLSIDSSYQSQFELRITSLTNYIRSLQK